MGFKDVMNYALYYNPVSSGTIHVAKSAAKSVSKI